MDSKAVPGEFQQGHIILLTPEMHHYIESMGDVLHHDWMPLSLKNLMFSNRR